MPPKKAVIEESDPEPEERSVRRSSNSPGKCYASEEEKEFVTRPLLIIVALVAIVILVIAFIWQDYGFFEESISILSFTALGVVALLGVVMYFRMRQIRLCKN